MSAEAAIEALGVGQVRDRAALAAAVDAVLAGQAAAVAEYRAGKTKVWHALKGLCMRATQGRADPEVLDELLRERLG
jgi:aspartyl-tRNA(Asn)/glutamyl-tRNA(Gln) amidotransferase subunit B